MKKNSQFHEYVVGDLLAGIPGVTSRAMFGGYGIYRNGVIFAIIADGRLYFKVDETNRSDYEHYESKPFTYVSPKGKKMTMGYWELPEEIMEERGEILEWVNKSVAANKPR